MSQSLFAPRFCSVGTPVALSSRLTPLIGVAEAQFLVGNQNVRTLSYLPGQKVWPTTRDLPLRVESHKLAPHFVGPFPFSKVTNPVAVRLHLPPSMRIQNTFHVSWIKPLQERALTLMSFRTQSLPSAWFPTCWLFCSCTHLFPFT